MYRYGGPANWKAMNENNIECYHCPTTHKHSFSEMFKVDTAHYLHREFDRGVYHTSYFQDSVADTLGITDRTGRPHYQFYYLWPNMYVEDGLSQRANGANFTRLWPDGVNAWAGETVRYILPAEPDVDPEIAAQLNKWNEMTAEEDNEAAARVQIGFRSGMYSWGYTLAESERNMRHFYSLVWKALEPAFRG